MRIVKPSVKHICFSDRIQQIGYSASICYASNKQGTTEWLEKLWNNGHKSVFRHGTRYYKIPSNFVSDYLRYSWKFNPYCGFYEDEDSQQIFISINEQYYVEHSYMKNLSVYEISELDFVIDAKNLKTEYAQHRVLDLLRYTFEIVTQISTSRELNRVSPNNICEQSTRYCNFNKDKFGNEITICQPHWFDILQDKKEISINAKNISSTDIEIIKEEYMCSGFIAQYLLSCLEAEKCYIKATQEEILAQDARGLLPLDTATKCIYTYRVEEWNHFLDLRYYGKTGTPHPNAKIIASMIKDELTKLNKFV